VFERNSGLSTVRKTRVHCHSATQEPNLRVSRRHLTQGRAFVYGEEVKEAVHTWLREQPKSFFSTGIQKLVERYNNYIVLQGDYVEK
jgi:hypothetical protein